MGRRVPSGKKKRFTLWLPDDVLDDLARQQDATGKGSIAEVLREAVEVYRSLIQARDQGVALFFENTVSGETGRMWILPGPPPAARKK